MHFRWLTFCLTASLVVGMVAVMVGYKQMS